MPKLSDRVPTIMGYAIPSWFKELAQKVEIQGKWLEAVEGGLKALVKRDLIEEALVLLREAPSWGDSPSFRRTLLSIQRLLERALKEKDDDPG